MEKKIQVLTGHVSTFLEFKILNQEKGESTLVYNIILKSKSDMCDKNFKTLKKETQEEIRR